MKTKTKIEVARLNRIDLFNEVLTENGIESESEPALVNELCEIIGILYRRTAGGSCGFTHEEIEEWIRESSV